MGPDTHVPLPRATVYMCTAHARARHVMPPQRQADGKDAGDGTAGALVLDGDGATMAVATVTPSAVVMRQ